jgi:phenylacetate-coenzyme A ligase PaaK-like adenylate-forming protein
MRGWMYEQLWRIKSHLMRPPAAEVLDFLGRSQYWSRLHMEELRDRKLRELVVHAYDQIPFYRRLLDERGVKPQSIEGVADLPRLPVMTKDIFRAHWSELRARDVPDGRVSVVSTGGTTGTPMRIARDNLSSAWSTACYIRGLAWAGLTLRHRRVRLFGGTLGIQRGRRFDRLRRWFSGDVFLPAFELGPHNVGDYAARIRRSGARFLIGYASTCYSLGTMAEAAGEQLSFRAVLPTGELCPQAWADAIAGVFSAKVLPYYGCGEVNSLAYSCPDGGVYHTCDEHAVIEVESDSGDVALEGEGAFLVTDLDNRAMPLIRYRNGDAGHLAGPGCTCGRTLGRILRLDGRVNDMLVTTTGTKFSGMIATHSFRLINHVESYQVVQRVAGQATVQIVRGPGYDPAVEEPKVYEIFRKHLGEGSRVAIEYVAYIAKTPAGKARFVINEYLATQSSAEGGAATKPR